MTLKLDTLLHQILILLIDQILIHGPHISQIHWEIHKLIRHFQVIFMELLALQSQEDLDLV